MAINFKGQRDKLLCFFTICMLFFQCTFEPSDVFISPITPPEPISVSFIINDPNFKDPYNLIAPTRLIFRLSDSSHTIIGTEVKVNGRSLNPEITRNGVEFVLNPYQMTDGNHTIRMSFKIDTKSGSLANRLGAEYYFVEQSFSVVIDTDPPVFDVFEANIENGFLTFRWNNTDKNNFVYIIRRRTAYGSLPDFIIYNTHTNHFIDLGYIGGYIDYTVIASGVGFERIIGIGNFYHEPIEFKIIKNPDGLAQLAWIADNINMDNLTVLINSSIEGTVEISTPLTTSGLIDLGLAGLRETISLKATVYRPGYFSQKYENHLRLDPTPNIKAFTHYKILKDHNKLIIGTDSKIYRYNLENLVLEDSITLSDHGIYSLRSLIVSPNGTQAYINDYRNIMSFDPIRFTNFIQYDIKEISKDIGQNTPNPYFESLGNVTDNGLISILFRKESNYSIVYDILSKKVIWQSAAGTLYIPLISDNGKYFATSEELFHLDFESWIYRIDNNQYYRMGKIDPTDFAFLANGTELMSFYRFRAYSQIYDGEFAYAYNLLDYPKESSGSFKKIRNAPIHATYNYSSLREITYDPSTNYIVYRYGRAIKLMNATTMKYEKTIIGDLPFFSNNYILEANGFIETVK